MQEGCQDQLDSPLTHKNTQGLRENRAAPAEA